MKQTKVSQVNEYLPSAIKFFTDQAVQKEKQDATEDENEYFWGQVRSLNGVDVVSDLPAVWNNCLNSVWEFKCQESLFYERDCIHLRNCCAVNECSCTKWRQVAINEKRLNPGRKKKRSKTNPKQTTLEDQF